MLCTTVPVAPPGCGKNTNYRFSRFFVRSVSLFRSLMLTPMNFTFQTDELKEMENKVRAFSLCFLFPFETILLICMFASRDDFSSKVIIDSV